MLAVRRAWPRTGWCEEMENTMQTSRGPSVAEQYERTLERVRATCERLGRAPSEVTVIAVSKMVDAATVRQVVEAGCRDLGESYVQEARPKVAELGRDAVRWHFIGHLQKNKVNTCLDLFDLIHSVDSADLARRIDARALHLGRRVPVLLEIELAGESTKFGVRPHDLYALMESIEALAAVEVAGLMTIPPPSNHPEDSRPYFKRLRSLADDLDRRGYRCWKRRYLSMGMSDDFEVALQEGADLVRVGRGIFGPRG